MSDQSGFAIRDGQTVVFIGDSITDSGCRNRAVPYGDGYVMDIIDLISARYPQRRIGYVNVGISGEGIPELQNRWADCVLVHKPDWVSVMIGINDCHRTLFPDHRGAVPLEDFAAKYAEVLERTRQQTGASLVLMDPFFVSVEAAGRDVRRSKVQASLPDYIAIVRDLAQRFGARHVPLSDIFSEQMRHRPPHTLAMDAVHTNRAGNLVIATSWLSAVGW